MEYKGYVGNVEFSEEDEVFFGKVIGIRSLISYEGATAKELIKEVPKKKVYGKIKGKQSELR